MRLKPVRQGAAIVETALVLPLWIIFAIGIADLVLCGIASSQASLAAQNAASYRQKYHHASDADMIGAAQTVSGVTASVSAGNYPNGNAAKTITCTAQTNALVPVAGFSFPATVSASFTYPE